MKRALWSKMVLTGIMVMVGIGSVAMAAPLVAVAPSGASGGKPNFLFILTDDQRASAIRSAGCTEIITPAMDRLISEGVLFSHATIMGGNTAAICLPSRSMIMTGSSLFKCGGVIPKDFTTMPESLRKNGYTTFTTGKWHNDEDSLLRSFEFGEAVFHGGMGPHFNTPVFDVKGGAMVNERDITTFDAAAFADATIKFLKSRPKDKPFFAYISFKTPHDPRVVPDKYHKMYDASKITLPPNFMPRHPFDNGELNVRDEKLARTPRTPDEIKQHIAAYYAATSATDDQIGRVLKVVDELGLAENTIVIFAGDNGLAVGQHGLMGKQNLYDHSARVPLVFRGRGVPKGKRSDALCQLFDICPTVLRMAGVKPPPTADGKDLGPVIKGQAQELRDATLHAYSKIQRAVRTRDSKLIEYLVDGKSTTQLFDLTTDPWEMKNLAGDPAHAVMLKTLRDRMAQLNMEYEALPLGTAFKGKNINGKKKGKKPKNAEADEEQ